MKVAGFASPSKLAKRSPSSPSAIQFDPNQPEDVSPLALFFLHNMIDPEGKLYSVMVAEFGLADHRDYDDTNISVQTGNHRFLLKTPHWPKFMREDDGSLTKFIVPGADGDPGKQVAITAGLKAVELHKAMKDNERWLKSMLIQMPTGFFLSKHVEKLRPVVNREGIQVGVTTNSDGTVVPYMVRFCKVVFHIKIISEEDIDNELSAQLGGTTISF
jgi:hypothetical protein